MQGGVSQDCGYLSSDRRQGLIIAVSGPAIVNRLSNLIYMQFMVHIVKSRLGCLKAKAESARLKPQARAVTGAGFLLPESRAHAARQRAGTGQVAGQDGPGKCQRVSKPQERVPATLSCHAIARRDLIPQAPTPLLKVAKECQSVIFYHSNPENKNPRNLL